MMMAGINKQWWELGNGYQLAIKDEIIIVKLCKKGKIRIWSETIWIWFSIPSPCLQMPFPLYLKRIKREILEMNVECVMIR